MELTVLDKSIYEILGGIYDEWVWTEPVKEDNTQLTEEHPLNKQENSTE